MFSCKHRKRSMEGLWSVGGWWRNRLRILRLEFQRITARQAQLDLRLSWDWAEVLSTARSIKKFLILYNHVVFIFVKASFYQNNVLFEYSIKMQGFMPILVLCADVFRAAFSWYWLPTLGYEKWPQEGGDSGDWILKFISSHFHNINNYLFICIERSIKISTHTILFHRN